MAGKKLTQEEFIRRAREKHGDKYDYSKAEYKGAFEFITIICPSHGLFQQKASDHLRGCGCRKCAVRKSLQDVLDEFKQAHGDFYDYSLVPDDYVDSKIPVRIICPTHGIFRQAPYHHSNGVRCPRCASRKIREESLVYGFGINDIDEKTRVKSYMAWRDMIGRCY